MRVVTTLIITTEDYGAEMAQTGYFDMNQLPPDIQKRILLGACTEVYEDGIQSEDWAQAELSTLAKTCIDKVIEINLVNSN